MSKESPVFKHLDTNYVPTSAEIDRVKEYVAHEEYLKDVIDVEIEALKKQLRNLVERSEAYGRNIEKHNALLSPARRLPDDILSTIFHLANSADTLPSATTLSHICQHWRYVALHDQNLWSTIHVCLPDHPSVYCPHSVSFEEDFEVEIWTLRYKRNLDMIRTSLSRSPDCPLKVIIQISPGSGDNEAAAEYLAVIMPTVSRWRELTVRFRIPPGDSPLLSITQAPASLFPSLRMIDMSGTFTHHPERWITANSPSDLQKVATMPLPQFTTAPSITSAWLRVPCARILDVPLQWGNLTSLTINYNQGKRDEETFGYTEALPVLSRCRNLRRCYLRFHRRRYPRGTPDPNQQSAIGMSPSPLTLHKVTLPHLRQLTIAGVAQPAIFASLLILPALCDLTIVQEPPGDMRNPDSTGVVQWFDMYGEQLTHAALDYLTLSHDGLRRCLGRLSKVTTLRLTGLINFNPPTDPWTRYWRDPEPTMIKHMMQLLTPGHPEGGQSADLASNTLECFCPILCTLEWWTDADDYIEQELVDFVVARRSKAWRSLASGFTGHQGGLREVVFRFAHLERQSRLNVREALVARGVDLNAFGLNVSYSNCTSRDKMVWGVSRHPLLSADD